MNQSADQIVDCPTTLIWKGGEGREGESQIEWPQLKTIYVLNPCFITKLIIHTQSTQN